MKKYMKSCIAIILTLCMLFATGAALAEEEVAAEPTVTTAEPQIIKNFQFTAPEGWNCIYKAEEDATFYFEKEINDITGGVIVAKVLTGDPAYLTGEETVEGLLDMAMENFKDSIYDEEIEKVPAVVNGLDGLALRGKLEGNNITVFIVMNGLDFLVLSYLNNALDDEQFITESETLFNSVMEYAPEAEAAA